VNARRNKERIGLLTKAKQDSVFVLPIKKRMPQDRKLARLSGVTPINSVCYTRLVFCLSFCIALGPQMRLAVIVLVIIVMASAIAMAFNYAHQPSYAAPTNAKRKIDANGNTVFRNR